MRILAALAMTRPQEQIAADDIATDILRVRNGRITDNWDLDDNKRTACS